MLALLCVVGYYAVITTKFTVNAKGAFAMLQTKKRIQEGFTIIEVMIVLAIAAAIMLLVFLAVPALNRSSHNTKRTNDVGALGAALTDYTNNNNGALPSTAADFSTNVTANAKLSFYDPTNVTYQKSGSATVPTDLSHVLFAGGYKCNGNAPTTSGATSRNVVALYMVENSGSGQAICKEVE